jgi:squalene synthase HpnC
VSSPAELASGKGHKDENFPVASWLVRPDARGPVMAYYDFARMADDFADHETATADEKLCLLGAMRAGLEGEGPAEAANLARVARARGLDLVHARDLITAFEQDCVQSRYADWDDLIGYCRYSAMPVGRWVLDVHGEDRALWPMNDALCAALQIINHLQDCGKDYRALDRVYVPGETLTRHGVEVAALGGAASPPGLRAAIRELAERTLGLLEEAAPFARAVRDFRLSAEVAVIQRLAVDLAQGLMRHDPLADRVHHGKARAGLLAMGALVRHGLWRIVR